MIPRVRAAYDRDGLEALTNGYSQDNFIGNFQFGKVYHGKDEDYEMVTVKVWDNCEVWPEDNEGRFRDECYLIYDDRLQSHPNMIKILGISWPDCKPTLVYELNALDTVHNLQDKDNFSWLHRVKVALGMASLVKCMHACRPLPYLIRNISAAHIMLDQDFNAKLYDFSMISGGILADKTELLNQHLQGCYGYIDPDYVCRGRWSKKCDVFAFGVVLIGLISKRVVLEKNKETSPEPFLYDWAHDEYRKAKKSPKLDPSEFSLVHKSLKTEAFFYPRDGVALTNLAMRCVEYNPQKRPTMKQVVNGLRKLRIVQNHADAFGLGNVRTVPRSVISELRNLMIKKLETYSTVKEKASQSLFKYLSRKDKLASAGKEMLHLAPKRMSYDDLKIYTNGFSELNFINIHQFGKLYHGKVDSMKVTVKTWENVHTHHIKPGDNESRLRDELILLQHPKFVIHPHIVKLIGYCYENERLGVVYDLQSVDSLQNLISKDSFTWHKRVIFILELARLVKYLQQRNPPYSPYLLRNICPHDILVDTHYKPKLFNFGMLSGGILNDRKDYRIRHVHAWDYYTDPYTDCYEHYTEVSDIYSLGMVIINVITKITDNDCETEFDNWIRIKYGKAKSEGRHRAEHVSLTDSNFCTEADFDVVDGHQITKLAIQCIHPYYLKRPTIDQVVDRLKNLKIMKRVSIEKTI